MKKIKVLKNIIVVCIGFVVGMSILIKRLYCSTHLLNIIYYIGILEYPFINYFLLNKFGINSSKLNKICSFSWFVGLIIGEGIYDFVFRIY